MTAITVVEAVLYKIVRILWPTFFWHP